jgi:hypothetical protein
LPGGNVKVLATEATGRYQGLIEPVLSIVGEFYPYGFAVRIRSNSPEVMQLAEEMWGEFVPLFSSNPIRVDVEVTDVDDGEIPQEPAFRLRGDLMYSVSDADNLSVGDLRRGFSHVTLSKPASRSPLWMRYFLVGAAPLCHIAAEYALPVHAGCVEWNGRGVLLCGESGDGKSTLSFACARAGWTYVTDDASYIVHGRADRLAVGNCFQIRFRPTAAELFPEVQGKEITPRAAGKPSIEIPTATMPELCCQQSTQVDYIVFLNRREPRQQELRRYDRDMTREFLRRSMFGTADAMMRHEESMERLLSQAQVLEMRYTDLDWAVERLQQLVCESGL